MTAILKKSSQLRKLSRNDIRLLWYSDFWDGPINGLCLCGDRKCWFEMLDADAQDLPAASERRFLVLDLSEPQLA
jgi:hypothetical protein